MLTVNNVGFSYSGHPLFSDLNLKLSHGEFCFLIGKSGAGKSSLLQMIYMNVMPHEGYIQVDDFDSRTIKARQLPYLRRKIGIVFQDFKLFKDRTIYDNVAFVLQVINTPGREIKRKVNDALTDVGLSHKRHAMPAELSGGEKQRVAIARAIVNEPSLILADEPTGNLDPETSGEIVDILKKINKKGTALLFATHNYDIVKRSEAKIIKLENGKAYKVILKQKT